MTQKNQLVHIHFLRERIGVIDGLSPHSNTTATGMHRLRRLQLGL